MNHCPNLVPDIYFACDILTGLLQSTGLKSPRDKVVTLHIPYYDQSIKFKYITLVNYKDFFLSPHRRLCKNVYKNITTVSHLNFFSDSYVFFYENICFGGNPFPVSNFKTYVTE